MRILAIRGENLASLAAPFDIDYEAPPLGDVGLFAIAGPTGSGKSTILDAMCLALFDTMPRLPSGHGVAVGRADEDENQRLKHNDVRSILRRGAGEAYAEVDFLGNDGERYRARWEVRRARRDAKGRVQPQQVSLTNLRSGEPIGQNKSEVLPAIRQRLGLSFDQFRRSVLLAQGDFAAFLRASADERAGLLERITGTELYTAISKAAYQRAGEEQTALQQLEARRRDFVPLTDDERAALQARLGEARQAVDTLNAQQSGIARGLAWYDEQEVLSRALTEAETDLAKAQAAFTAADGRRDQLERVRAVQPHRSVLDALRGARQRVEQAEQAVAEVEKTVAQRRQALQAARVGNERALVERNGAEQAYDAARPVLQQARELDTRIGIADQDLNGALQQQAANQADLERAEKQLADIQEQQGRARQAEAAAEAWLAAHQDHALLAREWPRWRRELDRVDQLVAGRRKLTQDLADNERQLEQARKGRDDLTVEVQAIGQALGQKQAEADRAKAALADLSVAELRQRHKALGSSQSRLAGRQELLRQVLLQRKAIDAAAVRLGAAESLRDRARQALSEAEREQPIQQARLAEADAAYQLALATRNQHAEHLRGLLREHAPCPVCGSEAHPWRDRPVVLDDQAAELGRRVEALKGQGDDLERRLARGRGDLESAATDIETARRAIADGRRELDALAGDWRLLPEDAFSARTFDDTDLADELVTTLAELGRQLEALEDQLGSAEALAGEADRLGGELDAMRREYEAVRSRGAEAREHWQTLEHGHQSLLRERQRLEVAFADVATDVAEAFAPLPDWRQAMAADPAGFARDCESRVAQWDAQTRAREQAETALRDLDRRLAEVEAGRRAQADMQAGLAADVEARRGALTQLQSNRAGLLQGRPTDPVEMELTRARDLARRAAEQAREALNAAATACSQADQTLSERTRALARERDALAEAETRHQRLLQRIGLSGDELTALLDFAPDWIAAEAEALEHLKDARQQALTVVAERRKALDGHQPQRPDTPRDALLQQQSGIVAALQEANDRLSGEVFALKQDDANRQCWQGMAEEIDKQAALTRLWASLNDLIGSADGKKFRVFAQSLTLEALLGYANAHLKDLSHRYRLQRVPNSDLDLQIIDADMGDEVRSVHSLSGGESFLVSLALALGLASLSSQRAQVESLFIDEGFGSLDQDALEVAISSLDSLQSLGRRVGVISHVQTLVERIGTRISVRPTGGGRSVVGVVAT